MSDEKGGCVKLLRRTDEAKLEAEIAGLNTRRDSVQRRLVDATAKSAAAVAEQRRMLTENDTVNTAALRRAGDEARRCQDDAEAHSGAVAALGALIADAEHRLAEMRAARERDAAARKVEAGAEEIEAAAADLARFCADTRQAAERFRAAMWAHAPCLEHTGQPDIYPAMRCAANQAGMLPLSEISAACGEPQTIADAVARVTTSLRTNAEAVRAGSLAPAAPVEAQKQILPGKFDMVRVALLREAIYHRETGWPILLQPGVVDMPEPIAASAYASKVGFPPESRQGQDIARHIKRMPNATLLLGDDGQVRLEAFTGLLNSRVENGSLRSVPRPAAPPPTDLGWLPDADGVIHGKAAA